jgi:hypothetical protein
VLEERVEQTPAVAEGEVAAMPDLLLAAAQVVQAW